MIAVVRRRRFDHDVDSSTNSAEYFESFQSRLYATQPEHGGPDTERANKQHHE